MGVALRTVQAGDIDVILEMFRAFYLHEGLRFDPEQSPTALRRLISDPSLGRIWLIDAGGETVGYLALAFSYSLEFYGRAAVIDEFFIAEAHRGHGVGTEVLCQVEAACPDLGIRALRLEVTFENAGVVDFYQRSGFAVDERHIMTKRLSW